MIKGLPFQQNQESTISMWCMWRAISGHSVYVVMRGSSPAALVAPAGAGKSVVGGRAETGSREGGWTGGVMRNRGGEEVGEGGSSGNGLI